MPKYPGLFDDLLDELAQRVADRVAAQLRNERPQPVIAELAPEYIDTGACAELLSMTRGALVQLRRRGAGPPYVRVGRAVRYRTNDVHAWLARKPPGRR